jgi:hypothetical protein
VYFSIVSAENSPAEQSETDQWHIDADCGFKDRPFRLRVLDESILPPILAMEVYPSQWGVSCSRGFDPAVFKKGAGAPKFPIMALTLPPLLRIQG